MGASVVWLRRDLRVHDHPALSAAAHERAMRAYGREAAVLQRYAELNADTARSWRDTVFHFSVFFALVDA